MLVGQYHKMTVVVRVDIEHHKRILPPEEDVILTVVFRSLSQFLAKNACVAIFVAENVWHAPGCPKSLQAKLHSLYGVGDILPKGLSPRKAGQELTCHAPAIARRITKKVWSASLDVV